MGFLSVLWLLCFREPIGNVVTYLILFQLCYIQIDWLIAEIDIKINETNYFESTCQQVRNKCMRI